MADERSGKLNRRDFIKSAAAGAAIISAVGCSSDGKKTVAGDTEQIVPRKMLGKTGMNVSILALGGGSALTMEKDDQKALAMIDLARRKGVNYFDSGSEYGGTERAQDRRGYRALPQGRLPEHQVLPEPGPG